MSDTPEIARAMERLSHFTLDGVRLKNISDSDYTMLRHIKSIFDRVARELAEQEKPTSCEHGIVKGFPCSACDATQSPDEAGSAVPVQDIIVYLRAEGVNERNDRVTRNRCIYAARALEDQIARAEKAEKERDEANIKAEGARLDAAQWSREYAAASALAAKRLEDLKKYATHHAKCVYEYEIYEATDQACTCGLTQAIEGEKVEHSRFEPTPAMKAELDPAPTEAAPHGLTFEEIKLNQAAALIDSHHATILELRKVLVYFAETLRSHRRGSSVLIQERDMNELAERIARALSISESGK